MAILDLFLGFLHQCNKVIIIIIYSRSQHISLLRYVLKPVVHQQCSIHYYYKRPYLHFSKLANNISSFSYEAYEMPIF